MATFPVTGAGVTISAHAGGSPSLWSVALASGIASGDAMLTTLLRGNSAYSWSTDARFDESGTDHDTQTWLDTWTTDSLSSTGNIEATPLLDTYAKVRTQVGWEPGTLAIWRATPGTATAEDTYHDFGDADGYSGSSSTPPKFGLDAVGSSGLALGTATGIFAGATGAVITVADVYVDSTGSPTGYTTSIGDVAGWETLASGTSVYTVGSFEHNWAVKVFGYVGNSTVPALWPSWGGSGGADYGRYLSVTMFTYLLAGDYYLRQRQSPKPVPARVRMPDLRQKQTPTIR